MEDLQRLHQQMQTDAIGDRMAKRPAAHPYNLSYAMAYHNTTSVEMSEGGFQPTLHKFLPKPLKQKTSFEEF